MRRILAVVLPAFAFVAMTVAVPAAWAGSPHFVGDVTAVRSGNSITVSGKLAGLGSESQVHIVVSVSAECINPGDNKPKAANKESFSVAGDFPVQNGKATFTLTVRATFRPDCTPPMTLRFSDVRVCDTTHNLCKSFSGTF
jgi:hypothetical protein